MLCKTCEKEIVAEWRLDKRNAKKTPLQYCSRACANSRIIPQEQRDRVALKNSGNIPWNKGMGGDGLRVFSSAPRKVDNLYEMSGRTITKILKRMKLPCFSCGWQVEGVVGDVHHILPKKNGGTDDPSNLTYLCPNCHRLAHAQILPQEDLKSIASEIGERWKKFYYVKD